MGSIDWIILNKEWHCLWSSDPTSSNFNGSLSTLTSGLSSACLPALPGPLRSVTPSSSDRTQGPCPLPPHALAILIIASFFAIISSLPQMFPIVIILLSIPSLLAYKRCCYYNCLVIAFLSHLLLAALGWPVKEDASREGRNIFLRLRKDTAWASLIRA